MNTTQSTQTAKPAADQFTVKLNNVRLSYPQLFTAKAMQNPDGTTGKPKFSATFLLNKKTHAKEIKQIEDLIQRACLEKFGKANIKLKHTALRDGEEKEDKEGYGEDVMFVPATSESRIPVVDADKTPLTEADGKIYGGCYVNAIIRLFAYSHPVGGKGVSAGLQAVQFAKSGESFGAARVDPNEAFDDVSGEDDSMM